MINDIYDDNENLSTCTLCKKVFKDYVQCFYLFTDDPLSKCFCSQNCKRDYIDCYPDDYDDLCYEREELKNDD